MNVIIATAMLAALAAATVFVVITVVMLSRKAKMLKTDMGIACGSTEREIMRAAGQLNFWQSAIGQIFAMTETENPIMGIESFRLIRAEIFNLNNCVYLQFVSLRDNQLHYFSYDETDPTHQISTVGGMPNPSYSGQVLTSYNVIARIRPEQAMHVFEIFGTQPHQI